MERIVVKRTQRALRRAAGPLPVWASAVMAMLALTGSGCGSDRDVTAAGTYYACGTAADCNAGYQCVCGWCQTKGATAVGCAANDTAANDTGTTDATGSCSPRTWVGCPQGKGCYFLESDASTFCLATGALKEGGVCDPDAAKPPCGKGSAGQPLLCDSVEKKCQPLCDTTAPACPNGWTCFPLGAQKRWADNTGVCAPL